MKSNFNFFIVLILVLSNSTGFAQIKNPITESIRIFGNCNMCKSTIEDAGNLKNQAKVVWDKDSKLAQITFDSKQTNRDEILKRIALAGYDSDEYLAPNTAYSQLAECCKYERQNKQPTIAMDHTKMDLPAGQAGMKMPPSENHMDMDMPASEKHSDMKMPATEKHTEMAMSEMKDTNRLDALFTSYFALKDALVKTNATSAAANSSELLNALKDLKIESLKAAEKTAVTMVMPSLIDAAKSISATKDIGKQRESFKGLSKNMHAIISIFNSPETIYYQYCPMQDANWLSKEKTVKNPYYGSEMLSCGSVVETIQTKN
ncbi:Copper chaperone CopZ [Flavobacteriaceae bacterium MAR_2010_188]|nr:Copper chaperone CopZ [Flavobacteriaceae bacterium MAR_2010_188]